MRDASESGLSTDSCRILFFAVFLVSLSLTPILGEKPPASSPPKYDLQTETKIKGTVEEVKLPQKGSEKEVAHLLVKNGSDTLECISAQSPFSTIRALASPRGTISR